jgi:hypothetical protein
VKVMRSANQGRVAGPGFLPPFVPRATIPPTTAAVEQTRSGGLGRGVLAMFCTFLLCWAFSICGHVVVLDPFGPASMSTSAADSVERGESGGQDLQELLRISEERGARNRTKGNEGSGGSRRVVDPQISDATAMPADVRNPGLGGAY